MTWELSPHVHLLNRRITEQDAYRQQATAAEICARLNDQPGLILADEVGMGKTFVAFAVAVSVLQATGWQRPVVVMVPPAVAQKWPRDWSVFEENCLLLGAPPLRVTKTAVRRGSEFLKLLDDPPARRMHLIFLTHGALSVSLNDRFIRLAIVRHAFRYQRRLRDQRAAFSRWAEKLLNDKQFTAARVARLLETHPSTWAREWTRLGGNDCGDDPVPAAALRAFGQVDLDDLRAALEALPLRKSPNIDQRLRIARQRLTEAVENVWSASLRHLGERMPLLILDEAHHVKNMNNLTRLFDSEAAVRDADAVSGNGPLANMFDRMLFLTATPFQLGHHELINILSRFSGARLSSEGKAQLRLELEKLTHCLDAAQAASLRLELAWGRLTPADLANLSIGWWDACPGTAPDGVRTVAARIGEAREALTVAQEALRPWVIRHTKDKRRTYRCGEQICVPDGMDRGIELTGPALMPFLLAARAQALVSLHGLKEHRATRAYFADGLSSSFEAFIETRAKRTPDVDDRLQEKDISLPPDVQWYVDRIADALPDSDPGNWSMHPKLQATVDEAVRLWGRGDKLLVFCFYRATGRALRSHISRALLAEIVGLGATALGLPPGDEQSVLAALEQRADTLLRSDAAGARVAADRVRTICRPFELREADVDQTVDVVLRFMRTASFLVRFFDFGARRVADEIEAAFGKADGSGVTLGDRTAEFAKLVAGLTEVEREGLWEALTRVQTGSISTVVSDFYEEGEVPGRREATLPNVRLANGGVRQETRQRLMRTFNTPFFPEVLVASSVMAEGVDLHLDCRHVIHHDLDWNPSTLEQRTGRLDRIGSKAELSGRNIVVYEPYMAGAQDEKMYRVVKDRERWFKVLMGERFDDSEWATDRSAERVPLPESLVRALAIDLSVPVSDTSAEGWERVRRASI